ncbi:hypothetical protein TNCT_514721 [Trichonephila clavata]|uniref:Uncharacterized protein n=1 Tax=Trichonephila clavata TaxID=2740835 RepID=A0A8X6GJQ7_TRICU|nr:hypothetical protein TNCT_514721 [Trichonephila clavata]
MKALICLCVVFSTIAVVLSQNPFGDMMNKAVGGFQNAASSAAQAMGGLAGGGNPMMDMIGKAEEMIKQASEGNPAAEFGDQMKQMFEQAMGEMSSKAQEAMQPLMQQMMSMQQSNASPQEYAALLQKMKQLKGT